MTNFLDFTIPVVITVENSKTAPKTCHVLSFSDKSLAITSGVALPAKSTVTLHLLKERIPFTVETCVSCEDNEGEFRCHLQACDDNVKLSSYFSSFSKFAS